MFKIKFFLICSLIFTFGTIFSIPAKAVEGFYYEYKAWEIACDNTRECRMIGYDNPGYDPSQLALLIARKAGSDETLQMEVQGADYDEDMSFYLSKTTLSLKINQKDYGILNQSLNDSGRWGVTEVQKNALIHALKGIDTIEFVSDEGSFSLSNEGFNAVMLKMDEFQGRLGTTTAIIKKGSNSAKSVYPSEPAPVIHAAKVFTPEKSKEIDLNEMYSLYPELEDQFSSECDAEQLTNDEMIAILYHLDDKHDLLESVCWRGAYNEGAIYWVIAKESANPVTYITNFANNYYAGSLFASHKGRVLGDCFYMSEWVWDGNDFVLNYKSTTGQCRLIQAGGTWELPTFVSKVIEP